MPLYKENPFAVKILTNLELKTKKDHKKDMVLLSLAKQKEGP